MDEKAENGDSHCEGDDTDSMQGYEYFLKKSAEKGKMKSEIESKFPPSYMVHIHLM